jgi:hypothetical protein
MVEKITARKICNSGAFKKESWGGKMGRDSDNDDELDSAAAVWKI